MKSKMCLATGGKHRWKYESRSKRVCKGCGIPQYRTTNGRWLKA
jgi:hypothetical protein